MPTHSPTSNEQCNKLFINKSCVWTAYEYRGLSICRLSSSDIRSPVYDLAHDNLPLPASGATIAQLTLCLSYGLEGEIAVRKQARTTNFLPFASQWVTLDPHTACYALGTVVCRRKLSDRCVILASRLHLVPQLRICGAVPPVSSSCYWSRA